MDYGKSFTYLFKDEKWISKFLIGVVVSLIPIVNLAALGYIVELVKNVRDGLKTPLPEWDEFGAFFFSGLKFFLGTLVYALPSFSFRSSSSPSQSSAAISLAHLSSSRSSQPPWSACSWGSL